jgi:hypothetical protein
MWRAPKEKMGGGKVDKSKLVKVATTITATGFDRTKEDQEV